MDSTPIIPAAAAADEDRRRRFFAEQRRVRQVAAQRKELAVFADPPGSGKTLGTLALAECLELTVSAPTHVNANQLAGEASRLLGRPVVAFPDITKENCVQPGEVRQAREYGFDFTLAVCSGCGHRQGCLYHQQREAAQTSNPRVATHDLVRFRPHQVRGGAAVWQVEEDSHNLWAPKLEAREGFGAVAALAENILDAEHHHRLTDGMQRFYEALGATAKWFGRVVCQRGNNEALPLPRRVPMPQEAHADLYNRACCEGIKQLAPALAFTVRAVRGDFLELYALDREEKKEVEGPRRRLLGISRTYPPEGMAVQINDASANLWALRRQLGPRFLWNRTLPQRLPLLHPVRQIIADVTKETSERVAAEILAGILWDHGLRRVGLIAHLQLVEPLKKRFPQVVKASYFHSGESRGSNAWVGECDALIVLGTPRVPPKAIQDYLLQARAREGLRRTEEACWYRPGFDEPRRVEDGTWTVVNRRDYVDCYWAFAYKQLVTQELRQALGRARAHLPQGMPAFVVTRENLGDESPIAVHQPRPLTEGQQRVLAVLPADGRALKTGAILRALRDPKNVTFSLIGPISEKVTFSRKWVYTQLTDLFEAGRVRPAGKDGKAGWYRTDRAA